MIKIKFFSSFCDSQNCMNVYERLCEVSNIHNYNKDYTFTVNDDYTHAIIINTAMPILKSIPKKNVIGIAFEPLQFLGLTKEFIEYAKHKISKYFIGDKINLPLPFIEHYGYMWHTTPLTYVPEKKNLMSIMISQKMNAPGHKYRHLLVQKILDMNLPIDIYGRGCMYYKVSGESATRIKGEFTEIEPYLSYKFHICIENYKTAHYFSEKITNPLLCNTIPIYLGCKNIDSYFPDTVIKLTEKIDDDIKLLIDIINNHEKYIKNINLIMVKDKINLLKNIDMIFN